MVIYLTPINVIIPHYYSYKFLVPFFEYDRKYMFGVRYFVVAQNMIYASK